MSYSDLIHRYFEGELEGEDYLEAALFDELHSNPVARQDFRDMLQIRSLCQEDMVSITTPSDCTTSVFAQLGFQIPSAAANNSATAAAGMAAGAAATGAARFASLRRIGSYVLTAALASAFTAAAFLYMQPDEEQSAAALNKAGLSALPNRTNAADGQQATVSQSNIPVSASYSQESLEAASGEPEQNYVDGPQANQQNLLAAGAATAGNAAQIGVQASSQFGANSAGLAAASSAYADNLTSNVGNQPHSPDAAQADAAGMFSDSNVDRSPLANNDGPSQATDLAAITPDAASDREDASSTLSNSSGTNDGGDANSAARLGEVISSATALDGFPAPESPAGSTHSAPHTRKPIGLSLSLLESKLLSVSYRRINSSSSFATDVVEEAGGNTLLLNNAIGMSYKLDDYNALGVEFGQEVYGQEFATEFRGQPGVEYQQRPALYWIGVNHRYDFNAFLELPEDLRLFEQTLLGVHNAGDVGAFTGGMLRTMLGAEYTFADRVTISAALEVSGISFSTASAMEFSYNTGFTYGLAYKF